MRGGQFSCQSPLLSLLIAGQGQVAAVAAVDAAVAAADADVMANLAWEVLFPFHSIK